MEERNGKENQFKSYQFSLAVGRIFSLQHTTTTLSLITLAVGRIYSPQQTTTTLSNHLGSRQNLRTTTHHYNSLKSPSQWAESTHYNTPLQLSQITLAESTHYNTPLQLSQITMAVGRIYSLQHTITTLSNHLGSR